MAKRDGRGRYVGQVTTIDRDAQALRLRAQGYSLQHISDALGYGGRGNVHTAIEKAKASVIAPPARELVEQELASLDYLIDVTLGVLHEQHVTVSHGRLITMEDGSPLPDHGPVMQAVSTLKGLYESRRKLLGLDAAIKLDATVHEVSEQDRELQELLREAQAANAISEAALRDQMQ
jgi:hypothetical protein